MSSIKPTTIKCPYCQASLVLEDPAEFRVRCNACGRTVLARDWRDVLNDPDSAYLFEPVAKNQFPKNAMPTASSIRLLMMKSQTFRSKVLWLVCITTVASAVAGGIFTGWYLFMDVFLSGLIGLLLATFTLILPEVMVAIGAGGITMLFCSYFFGLYGNRIYTLLVFFAIGFCVSVVLQVARWFLTNQAAISFARTSIEKEQGQEHEQSS